MVLNWIANGKKESIFKAKNIILIAQTVFKETDLWALGIVEELNKIELRARS
jgi:hypothetical protein